MDQRRVVAHEYISKKYPKKKILKFVNLSRSTFYYKPSKINKKRGRPVPGYSVNKNGTLTPDNWIVQFLKNYRSNINFQNAGGYRALHYYLEHDYQINVNHKKLYRLCKESKLLLRRKKKIKKIKSIANNIEVTRPNQLWQFDIKYGYIHGEDRAFYFLVYIDIFTKEIQSYHLGKNCTKEDLKITLKSALNKITKQEQDKLIIRSDNGPQMSSNAFKDYIKELDITHEFTPVRCPNKNAYVESFFSIFDTEFIQVRYFNSMKDVHKQVREWVYWYNQKRLHGSLKYLSPLKFKERYIDGNASEIKFCA